MWYPVVGTLSGNPTKKKGKNGEGIRVLKTTCQVKLVLFLQCAALMRIAVVRRIHIHLVLLMRQMERKCLVLFSLQRGITRSITVVTKLKL